MNVILSSQALLWALMELLEAQSTPIPIAMRLRVQKVLTIPLGAIQVLIVWAVMQENIAAQDPKSAWSAILGNIRASHQALAFLALAVIN